MMATEIATVGNDQHHAAEQHLAQRDAEQAGQGEGADAGDREDDSALEADGHRGGHLGGAVLADLLGEVSPQRGRHHQQHVEEDRLQSVAMVSDSA